MRIEDLIPASGMPRTFHAPNRIEQWFGLDSLASYQKRGGHPVYSETDITYRYNSLGYRCPEFDVVADLRMISIGCSWTFGAGLPQDAIFHELFAAKLRTQLNRTVVNWNLGLSGTGGDYLARVLPLAVPLLDPHIVLILFPALGRREYMAAHNRYMTYIPNYFPPSLQADAALNEVCNHFASLSSSQDNQLHLFRNYKSVETLLADRCWLFAFTNPAEIESVGTHLDRSRMVSLGRAIDKARDDAHPGPRSHEAIFQSYWDQFILVGGLDRFASQ